MTKHDDSTPADAITAKALASELGVTPRVLRRILRSMTDDRAGKGGTWALTPEVADAIRTRIEQGPRRTTTPTLKD